MEITPKTEFFLKRLNLAGKWKKGNQIWGVERAHLDLAGSIVDLDRERGRD